jgi:hypothetical protein
VHIIRLFSFSLLLLLPAAPRKLAPLLLVLCSQVCLVLLVPL